jgi:hypothetical protein
MYWTLFDVTDTTMVLVAVIGLFALAILLSLRSAT